MKKHNENFLTVYYATFKHIKIFFIEGLQVVAVIFQIGRRRQIMTSVAVV
jgi:hypothetical protein